MSSYTNWYHLDKYEGQDKPNLLDQYNSAMDKVDSALHQIAESGGSGGGGSVPADITQRLTKLEIPANNPYDGKNIVFIGDSYTTGDGLANPATRYSTLLSNALNCTEFNYAINGTGFVYKTAANNKENFGEQVILASNAMSNDDKNDTFLVIIAGGINEVRGVNTYTYDQEYAGTVTAITNARTLFPNAKILVVPMMYRGFQFTKYARNMYDAIVNAVHQSRLENVETLEGCYTWNWGDASLFNADKLHPNQAGHAKICNYIMHGIFGEHILWENKTFEITWDTSLVEPGSNPNYESGNSIYLKNGIVYVEPMRLFVRSTDIQTNQTAGTVPAAASPSCTAYGFACGAQNFYGVFYITHFGPAGIACTNWSEMTVGQGFNASPIIYPLYGRDYGLTA